MLELRSYTKAEIAAILGTENRQGIQRKLSGYGVEYKIDGWGDYTLTITAINDPFKVFCITTLGVPAQADFDKLKILYYHLLCCPGFAEMPYEVMAGILSHTETPVSNKTIAKWVEYLQTINYFAFDKEDCCYYAIRKYKDGRRVCEEIDKEKYSVGWKIYWNKKAEEGSANAYLYMFNYIGGHPCRKAKMKPNAFYLSQINQLIEILNNEFMKQQLLPEQLLFLFKSYFSGINKVYIILEMFDLIWADMIYLTCPIFKYI